MKETKNKNKMLSVYASNRGVESDTSGFVLVSNWCHSARILLLILTSESLNQSEFNC